MKSGNVYSSKKEWCNNFIKLPNQFPILAEQQWLGKWYRHKKTFKSLEKYNKPACVCSVYVLNYK